MKTQFSENYFTFFWQVMEEIRRVLNYIEKELKKDGIIMKKNLCVCLSARRNLCIHPEVSQFDDRGKVDALCRNLTAQWVRNELKTNPDSDIELCSFFEGKSIEECS